MVEFSQVRIWRRNESWDLSWCPLCATTSENIQHTFFECPFAKCVWKQMLEPWGDVIQLPGNIQECFTNWEKMYNGDLNKKKRFRECWMKLPKVICWCIWIERNHRIFQDKALPAWQIAIKAHALISDIVSAMVIPKNKTILTDNERNWMQSINPFAEANLAIKMLEKWEITLDKSQFENWLKEMKIFKLFFDGASKGNPGMAGGGGVIIFPEGKTETKYCWNIGQDSIIWPKLMGYGKDSSS